MPVKNGENFLFYSISSIFSQTLKPVELIVVNDHSSDSTLKLLESLVLSFNIEILNATSNGMCSALQQGIDRVKTKYVAFLDHDDYWDANKQKSQMDKFNAKSETKVVCSGVRNFLNDNSNPTNFELNAKNFLISRLFSACTFSTVLLQKEIRLNPRLGHFQWLMDWWSMAQREKIKVEHMNEIHLYRRIHENNNWVTENSKGKTEIFDFIRSIKKK